MSESKTTKEYFFLNTDAIFAVMDRILQERGIDLKTRGGWFSFEQITKENRTVAFLRGGYCGIGGVDEDELNEILNEVECAPEYRLNCRLRVLDQRNTSR